MRLPLARFLPVVAYRFGQTAACERDAAGSTLNRYNGSRAVHRGEHESRSERGRDTRVLLVLRRKRALGDGQEQRSGAGRGGTERTKMEEDEGKVGWSISTVQGEN